VDDLAFETVGRLRTLLRRRQVSSVELTTFFLERLTTEGPHYNALAEATPELALAQARRADRLIARGEATSPLVGIPYGAKDLLATRGVPTRWGAPPYQDQIPTSDAAVIRRMRDAGAVLVGKLAMVELAGGGGYSSPAASLHGPGRNPWNLEHWAGGSSSGSASAVAAGLVPLALGSETMGSLMGPGAFCGLSVLRPTWGLVSRHGAMELAATMDKVGPMAHTAEDCGLALQAIAGRDPADEATGRSFRYRRRRGQRPYRIGVLPLDYSEEPDTAQVFEEALRALRRAGMKVRSARPLADDLEAVAGTILRTEAALAHRELIESERVGELVDEAQVEGLRSSLEQKAVDYEAALRRRARATAELLAMCRDFDALVAPTNAREAPAIDADLRAARGKRRGYAMLGAIAGVPCLTVPMGFGPKGLPLGLSITGNLFDENTILAIGSRYQRETDWHRRRPPAPDTSGGATP